MLFCPTLTSWLPLRIKLFCQSKWTFPELFPLHFVLVRNISNLNKTVPMWQSGAARWRIWRTTCWSDACSRDTAAASGGPAAADDGGTLQGGRELGDKQRHVKEVSVLQQPGPVICEEELSDPQAESWETKGELVWGRLRWHVRNQEVFITLLWVWNMRYRYQGYCCRCRPKGQSSESWQTAGSAACSACCLCALRGSRHRMAARRREKTISHKDQRRERKKQMKNESNNNSWRKINV